MRKALKLADAVAAGDAGPTELEERDARRAITARRTGGGERALIHVDMGEFNHAVPGLRADLAEHPLTKGVMSSD